MISSLIDTQDNWERVRDQIAAILKAESENQQDLAAQAGVDPTPWAFRVFVERRSPQQVFLDPRSTDLQPRDMRPVIHVAFNNWNVESAASNTHSRQRHKVSYYIDCIGAGVSKDDPDGGHIPGDQEAIFASQRSARFVRKVLMSECYHRLGFPLSGGQNPVVQRMFRNAEAFDPSSEEKGTILISPLRLQFEVSVDETSPKFEGVPLEAVAADLIRVEDGEVLLQVEATIEQS